MSSATPRLTCLLAASDLSEDSDKGLLAAAALAGAARAKLHVIHCVPPPVFPYWEGPVSHDVFASWERSARTDLEWQVQRVLGEIPGGASLEVRLGEPAHEIASAAQALGADLIVVGPHAPRALFDDVLGTHGFGMLGRALVGSVASSVARQLPFSILMVPPA